MVGFLAACPLSGPGGLELRTSAFKGGQATLTAVATDATGKVGTGTVHFTSTAGSLVDGVDVTLDAFGTAVTDFSCDQDAEAACATTVTVTATWTPKGGVAVTQDLSVKPRGVATGDGGSGGGTGGTGGGTGSSLFASSQVLLFGTLMEGAAGVDALAPLEQPTQTHVGFPSNADPLFVTNDGNLIYVTFEQMQRFYRWVPEQLTLNSMTKLCRYPANPVSNDLELVGSATCGALRNVKAWPDTSALVFQCADMSWESGGATLNIGANNELLALGFGGNVLVRSQSEFQIRSSQGAVQSAPSASMTLVPMNATAEGFLLVDPTACALWLLKYDGTLSQTGTFAPLPPGFRPINGNGCISAAQRWRTLDRDGNLYVWGNTGDSADRIAKRPITPGTSTVVYDESKLPPTDYSSCSKLPTRIHDFSLLAR